MARRRSLRPEEEELWHAVARTATPLHPIAAGFSRKPDAVAQTPPRLPDPDPGRMRLPAFRLGEKVRGPAHSVTVAPTLAEVMATAPLQMDAKAFGRMTRGKLAPEARIDLHGMTLSEAQPELIRFILNAHIHGMRLVLVITGKGKRGADHGPIPQRMGALRHQVPQWLRLPPLGPVVLQVAEAHLKHGGSGACYVYLRRGR